MLTDSMRRGGTERRLTELIKSLTKLDNIEVELIVLSNKFEFVELYELGIPIYIIERRIKKDPRTSFRIYKICQQIKPDIIHSWGSMSTIFALPAKWFLRPHLVNSTITDAPHNLARLDLYRLRFLLTVWNSDAIVANSQAGLDAYAAPRSKSFCIYNGFAFDRIKNLPDKATVRSRYQIPDQKIVGMVGAFESRKDYPSFIDIANQILSERKDVVFIALGGGSMLEECKGMVDPKYKTRMIFTGNIPDVESVIQLFTIGVLISNTLVHGEGISNAIMEYMAAGKPVLANDNGGNKEIIQHEKTGYILDNTNTKSWCAKINYLLDQPEIAEKMGQAGRDRIASTFEMGKMTSRFVELYSSLMTKSEKMSRIWAQDQ